MTTTVSNTRITVKKICGHLSKTVFVNGNPVAQIAFNRSRGFSGRVDCGGYLRFNDGRVVSLDGYSYWADVVKFLPAMLAEAGIS